MYELRREHPQGRRDLSGVWRQTAGTTPATQTGGGSDRAKDPRIAAVLSFFVTGLGQIYDGEIAKGILLLLVQGVNFFLIFVLVGLVTFQLVWSFGVCDADESAERIDEREARSGSVTRVRSSQNAPAGI